MKKLLLFVSILAASLPGVFAQNLTVSTWAGDAGQTNVDGTGSNARFNNPWGVAVDSSGNVYVAETDSHIIRKVTSGGMVTTVAGLAGTSGSTDATGTSARFNLPQGIAVDASGNLYVTDSGNHTIRKITSGGVVTTIAGSAGSSGTADGSGSSARFNNPEGIALSGTTLYVADTWN
ncbi:MAG: NHL domain-containing protein, partial [Limisphaerales bacterium]